MHIYNKEIPLSEDIIEYFKEDMLLFDIETLGLSARYAPIYLIGCMYREGNLGQIRLFFGDTRLDEPDLLTAFWQLANNYNTLVTFNGLGFDVSFVYQRAEKYHLDIDPFAKDQIDLYKVAKRHKKLLGLTHLRQKSLEEFFGLYREDEYDGGKLIDVYKRFERCPDKKLKHLLLLHNYEDVKGMSTLLPMLAYERLSKSSFNILSVEITEPDKLVFKAKSTVKIPKPIRLLTDDYHLKYSENTVSGYFTLFHGELNYYLKNHKDYVFLINEGTLLPKELSKSLPKDSYEKASKENCYIKDCGLFFPIPTGSKIKSFINLSDYKLFSKDCGDKQQYFPIKKGDSAFTSSPELEYLLANMLSYCFS